MRRKPIVHGQQRPPGCTIRTRKAAFLFFYITKGIICFVCFGKASRVWDKRTDGHAQRFLSYHLHQLWPNMGRRSVVDGTPFTSRFNSFSE